MQFCKIKYIRTIFIFCIFYEEANLVETKFSQNFSKSRKYFNDTRSSLLTNNGTQPSQNNIGTKVIVKNSHELTLEDSLERNYSLQLRSNLEHNDFDFENSGNQIQNLRKPKEHNENISDLSPRNISKDSIFRSSKAMQFSNAIIFSKLMNNISNNHNLGNNLHKTENEIENIKKRRYIRNKPPCKEDQTFQNQPYNQLQPIELSQTQNILSVDEPAFELTHSDYGLVSSDASTEQEDDSDTKNSREINQTNLKKENVQLSNIGSESQKLFPYAKITAAFVRPKPPFYSTCQTVLDDCRDNSTCRVHLDPVLSSCHNNCNREKCMASLSAFYRSVEAKWAMDTAFCLCKKSHLKADKCSIAQDTLHPACARRPQGTSLPLCHELVDSCKLDASCRHRLEFFEQGCAVNNENKKCLGTTLECRRALLGILGTRIRNVCTCASAPTPAMTYTCLDWQKILWFNPCVVESQADYHRDMVGELEPGEKLSPSGSITWIWTTTHSGMISTPAQVTTFYPLLDLAPKPRKNKQEMKRIKNEIRGIDARTKPTLPPDLCTKQLRNDEIDTFPVGTTRRYYNTEENTCSELCQCSIGKKLTCKPLKCVPPIPCVTDYAVFNHGSPSYLAMRGLCLCYSESFICARPKPEYLNILEKGLYLIIGYSKKEEELLKPRTNRTVVDAVLELQELYTTIKMNKNETFCVLELNSLVQENVVVRATLPEFLEKKSNLSNQQLIKEKKECESSLEDLSQMINRRSQKTYQNALLSMFLVSEVQARVPLTASANSWHTSHSLLVPIICIIFFRNTHFSW